MVEEDSVTTAKKPAYWKVGGIIVIVIVAMSLIFFFLFKPMNQQDVQYKDDWCKQNGFAGWSTKEKACVGVGNTSDVGEGNTEPEPLIDKPILSDKECGDGICGLKEDYSVCKTDCITTCGDGVVQDSENWKNCRLDLMKDCGNGKCDSWEHYRYCPEDCAECIVDDRGTYTGPNKCPPSPRWV